MNEAEFYGCLLLAYFLIAPVIFVILLFIPAPYGRYTRSRFGPTVDRRFGWVVMEAPAALVLPLLFLVGNRPANIVAIAFLLLWESHYVNRAFWFPFKMRGDKRQMTVLAMGLGLVFNLGNGYLNGRFLFFLSPPRDVFWLMDPRFLSGVTLFVSGTFINRQSDAILRDLRPSGDGGYRIPYGGWFKWVSCPNYTGEILEWLGWALATWSWAGLAFAVWTTANLLPRALAHHVWYQRNMEDYPPGRRALIPFVL